MSYNPRIQRLERIHKKYGEVPLATSSDNGKIPIVDTSGEYVLEDIPKQLPITTVLDAGKFVIVNDDGTGYILVSVPYANGNSF